MQLPFQVRKHQFYKRLVRRLILLFDCEKSLFLPLQIQDFAVKYICV